MASASGDYTNFFNVFFDSVLAARNNLQFSEAYKQLTNALDIYHRSGYNNLFVLSDILWQRADVSMMLGYKAASQDIAQAIKWNPKVSHNSDEANKWLNHAIMASDYGTSLSCVSGAFHFCTKDQSLRAAIYGFRAALFHETDQDEQCNNDVKKCRTYDPKVAKEKGECWKKRGIRLFHSKNYKNSVRCLLLAEKFLMPFENNSILNTELNHHLHDCLNFMACATWNLKQFVEALRAGKKCYTIKSTKDKIEASRWRMKGNEIIKESKYDLAVECYSLAIQYAPLHDTDLQGILHSNRSSAYFRMKQYLKAKEDAETCLNYCTQWSKSYHRLASALLALQRHEEALDVLRKGLNVNQCQNEQYQLFLKIVEVITSCKGGYTMVTFKPPPECLSIFLQECVVKEDWKIIELLFLGGGGQQSYPVGAGGIATGCNVSQISLSQLIKSKKKVDQFDKLLNVLIDHGASVNGLGDLPPLSVAVNEKDYESAVLLLEKKADVNGLLRTKIRKPEDTPIHTAFRIGLSSGSWNIFDFLMGTRKNCIEEPGDFNSEVIDGNGNSLFHLVCFGERVSFNINQAITLLKKYNVNPTTRNRNGQTPLMMLRRKRDERFRLIEEIVRSFASCPSKKKKKNRKNKKNRDSFPDLSRDETSFSNIGKSSTASKALGQRKEKDEENRESKFDKESRVFSTSELDVMCDRISKIIDNLEEEEVRQKKKDEKEALPLITPNLKVMEEQECVDVFSEDKRPLPSNDDLLGDYGEKFDNDSDCLFDNLTWEVECTSDIWKILSSNQLSLALKKRIIGALRQLANGYMHGYLAIGLELFLKGNDIRLFKAKVAHGVYVLWERAVAFSPRCSNNSELLCERNEVAGRIYSDIIRVWDIVFDPETVSKKIANIVRSHQRGSTCFIKKPLQGFEFHDKLSSSKHNHRGISVPKLYTHKRAALLLEDVPVARSNEVSTMFFPPGSPEETEYQILKFYAFSNSLVNAVLDDHGKTNVDFPFQVSELEHAVINLKPCPMTSLLLLGRSGTGKTTCCLYRLWCNFQTYWQRHTIDEPSIPKMVQFIPKEAENDVTDAEGGSCGKEDGDCERLEETDDEDRSRASRKGLGDLPTNSKKSAELDIALCSQATCEDPKTSDEGPVYEHLHQAFITKNAVLCTEVQKNFLDLSRACSATQSHTEYERPSSVNTFNQLGEQAWPLFVCSHDWLLMLDASLPGPEFFPRNDEGELLRSVKGWGEEDIHLQEIPEDNSEDEDDDEIIAESNPKRNEPDDDDSQAVSGVDLRLEVTYQVFKNELWPKMTKKRKVDYHPSLVWTEIRSFIKGSVEALHSKDGYITLEEYQTLGRKRAPNFSADREIVYELFRSYQRIKRSKGMFDEADLVYSIYHRLQHHVAEWSIHEIYVDETQDFTQAELSVIIRCCRDPNRLFFTGDTAQSIMRGIAFRFNDLKSLFYYMKESYRAVGHQAQVRVPDRVYQLTHNYRSHAGILDVACSVIDLLLHFFPESFDRMERDQGLFQGPKPVLLESCSFSDLAVILRGHKRKTSPIEFGAHQVVLVASDEVRDSLPEELGLALVMTIYEAKGLEFDDVLIYNFFKDSQAQKEWRVVTSYEGGEDSIVVSEAGIAEILEDNLKTKTRPLEFNPDRHKILISEFKFLYTALTRARVNVWLFDENEEARAPMFEYFKKRGVVEVKRPRKTDDDKVSLEGMFAEKSSKEEWRNQGNFFYGKGLWKVALQCFIMADDATMVKKCHAQIQAVKAASLRNEPRKLKMEFMKAADFFLQCGMNKEAAICLHNAGARLILAKLYQKLGKVHDAAKLFRRERKFLEASENFEKGLDFMRAVDCLLQSNHYDQAMNVISRCQELVQDRNDLAIVSLPRFDQRDESICYQAAEYYLKRGQLDLMTSALERLPEIKDRITFLQKNGCIEQAAGLLLREGKAQEAAEMMRSSGKFLEAASFTENDVFAAECYLIAARLVLLKEKEKEMTNEETKEIIEAPLQRAAELYERCSDLNGQAEVKFVRGRFYGRLNDLLEAWNLYHKAYNYTGMAECVLLLIDIKEELPRTLFFPTASSTVIRLLDLVGTLHKKNQENIDRTVTFMCEKHFGLVDTEKSGTREVPALEMVRFSSLKTKELEKNKEINVKDAYKVIKEHLYEIAADLVQRLWLENQCVLTKSKPCPRYLAGTFCEEEKCKHYHGGLTKLDFADRFYILRFLIHLEGLVAKFLKELQQESIEVTHNLEQDLLLPYEFKACQWLKELLFPKGGQLGQLYVLTERQLSALRQEKLVRNRIIGYAMSYLWYGASQEERWSDSDIFITVSNLMHLAAAPAGEIFNLLGVEERKFESINIKRNREVYGFFPDARKSGRFEIFSKWLEHAKNALHGQCDVVKATHSAIKIFLFTPARRCTTMPYPSIANVVAILEYYITACLLLHIRVLQDRTGPICLPASYLSMINFWDMVNRSQVNQSPLYNVIQLYDPEFHDKKTSVTLQSLRKLSSEMVALMFGGISKRYNIFTAALCDKSTSWGEAERALILALTMLCNCGRGIPLSCEVLIRQQFDDLQLHDNFPDKLTQCIGAVQESSGTFEVVNALQELLSQEPREELLLDVKWNETNGSDMRRTCQAQLYPRSFCSVEDVELIVGDSGLGYDLQESDPRREDDIYYYQADVDDEDENNHSLADYECEKKREMACISIQNVFRAWKERKRQKETERISNDPVESRFQMFKLDRSGCTICGTVQFERHSIEVSHTSTFSSPVSVAVKEGSSNWQPKILKRNTYISHSSPESPHWKKKELFEQFKQYYRKEVYPFLMQAQEIEVKMKLEEEGSRYALDLDRLEQGIKKVHLTVKKVEKERAWDQRRLLCEAVRDVVEKLRALESMTTRKGKSTHNGSTQVSSVSNGGLDKTGDEFGEEKDCVDEYVGGLKEVSSRTRKSKKEVRNKKKRKRN